MLDYYPLKRLAGTHKPHDTVVKTICQECTVGCGLLVYLQAGMIVDVQGDEQHPVSRGRLCAKGIAFPQGLNHPERISHLAERADLDSSLVDVDNWEKTLDSLAERLRKIKARYGPRSLMIGCDPDAGLDFYIGALRFARLWGTPHVFHPLYAPRGISAPAHDTQGSVPHCWEWPQSRCIVLLEADLATTHPVAFSWLLDAKNSGTEIIALDSRFTTTLSKADVALQIKPESGNTVGLALMKAMIEENLYDQSAAHSLFTQSEQWRASFESMAYDGVAEITGLAVEKVQELARLITSKKPVTLITGQRLANRQNSGIWRTLAVAAGWSGLQGGGWYPLDAGLPPWHPYADIDAKETGGAATDEEAESDADASPEVVEDPESPLQALICSGNCLHDFMSPLRAAAKNTQLNIFFGAFPNDTWKLSHVAIPATLWPETEQLSFTNDRAIQWGGKVVEAKPGCRSGLEFWTGLAQRMADVKHLEWKAYFPWQTEAGSADHPAFYGWLLDQSPYTAGYNPDQLATAETALKIWPRQEKATTAAIEPESSGPIEPLLAPTCLKASPPVEEAELFPLTFQTTRIISRSGDASSFWPGTKDLEDAGALQIHPETAQVLGIENGDEVLVHGSGEVIEARAWITRMVPKEMIWSARKLGSASAVVHKKGESGEEAPQLLGEFLR